MFSAAHHRSRAIAILLAVGASVALAGCSSSSSPTAADKSRAPAQAYDAQISLCPNANAISANCSAPVTAAQIADVRARLVKDKTVTRFRYLSAADSYAIDRAIVPANVRSLVTPGLLPPAFVVSLTNPTADYPTWRTHYTSVAGVDAVSTCKAAASACSVAVLRSTHVLH